LEQTPLSIAVAIAYQRNQSSYPTQTTKDNALAQWDSKAVTKRMTPGFESKIIDKTMDKIFDKQP
jgi:hypothetical protein